MRSKVKKSRLYTTHTLRKPPPLTFLEPSDLGHSAFQSTSSTFTTLPCSETLTMACSSRLTLAITRGLASMAALHGEAGERCRSAPANENEPAVKVYMWHSPARPGGARSSPCR